MKQGACFVQHVGNQRTPTCFKDSLCSRHMSPSVQSRAPWHLCLASKPRYSTLILPHVSLTGINRTTGLLLHTIFGLPLGPDQSWLHLKWCQNYKNELKSSIVWTRDEPLFCTSLKGHCIWGTIPWSQEALMLGHLYQWSGGPGGIVILVCPYKF